MGRSLCHGPSTYELRGEQSWGELLIFVTYGLAVGAAAAPDSVRMSELLAALSLGIDLGFGQPMEHVLRQCRIALRLCEAVAPDDDERVAVYYSALLIN